MKPLTTGRLAHETGVNLETVRFYERRGLLPKPPRSASGYRLYPVESLRRLRFIHRAKELGFSLAEIKELLSLRLSGGTSAAAAVRKRAEAKIGEIETKIKTLKAMRQTLRTLATACDGCGPISECPILESFEQEGR